MAAGLEPANFQRQNGLSITTAAGAAAARRFIGRQ